MPSEDVTEFEIEAYVDNELDLARRMAVEEHLARHADLAARVMHDLSDRTALRLLQGSLASAPALDEAARQLSTRLARQHGPLAQLFTPLRLGIAGLSVGLVALSAFVTLAPAHAKRPAFVTEAAESYRTSLLRANMPSQLETATFDARDVQRETRLLVPSLRADWRITDVQIFPSDEGPALQIMAVTATGQAVSMYAVRTTAPAPDRPVAFRGDGASIAYWRRGNMGYALIGAAAPRELDAVAEDLADNRLS